MKRLSSLTLPDLPTAVIKPRYDRTALKTGHVHLGLGGFHRAHQAYYTESVLNAGDLNWGILGVSLRSPAMRDALCTQDGLYTLSSRGEDETHHIIGAVHRLMVAPENPAALIQAMVDPAVKLVSLTITEKGYCIDASRGALNLDDPAIQHDLSTPNSPKTAPGFLLAAIKLRRASGIKPFTLLSCDNLPSNGTKLHRILIDLARENDRDLASYIEDQISSPSTMVDRIVPQTTDHDRQNISQSLGLEDKWPVITEPFTQWVIEDRFSDGRPDWSLAGAEFVANAAPYEMMKLRLLNASHTLLAFLGAVAGFQTVAEAMQNPILKNFISYFMVDDVTPVLRAPQGANAQAYASSLIKRFQNPALHHRLDQITSDSSQKIPQRWIETACDRLNHGLSLGRLAYGIAGFILYAQGNDEQGQSLIWKDPLADQVQSDLRHAGDNAALCVDSVLSRISIFGDLGTHPSVRIDVISAYEMLRTYGVIKALGLVTPST